MVGMAFLAPLLVLAQQTVLRADQESRAERVYGVTVDRLDGLEKTLEALRTLGRKPTVRIVFDEDMPAEHYREAAGKIHEVAFVMGEILDSQFVKKCTLEGYRKRTGEYLETLGGRVDLWEVGNEINGDWLGPAEQAAAKMTAAFDLVKERKKAAALTLYYNEGSVKDRSFEMFRWAEERIPDRVKQGLDYAWVSFYDDDFEGPAPDWPAVFERLGKMFPAAKLGIGECGTKKQSRKAEFVRRYYGLKVDHPRFVSGCFWWYFSQDMVPSTRPLWKVLQECFAAP